MRTSSTLLALALLVSVLACNPKPGQQPPTARGMIDCGSQAIVNRAPDLLPGVNQCLGGSGDITMCLVGLAGASVGVVADTVACLARHEGAAAASAAKENPFNEADKRRAARAREFLEKNDIRFTDNP